jgi:hypothetical protein
MSSHELQSALVLPVELSKILELYSDIALSRKPFKIGHMYIYSFFA